MFFKDSLRIGDFVLLRDSARNALLSCEGILLEDLSVVDGIGNLQEAIFCVHLQRQYSASRDLQAFLRQYGNDIKSTKDSDAKKYLQALQVF
ncbi:hypothetical protein EON65_25410 [archaeon]|nr:MAG: hypothetical protein EON65_25410 [archaeon]